MLKVKSKFCQKIKENGYYLGFMANRSGFLISEKQSLSSRK